MLLDTFSSAQLTRKYTKTIGLKKNLNLGTEDFSWEWYWVPRIYRDLTGMMGWGGVGVADS